MFDKLEIKLVIILEVNKFAQELINIFDHMTIFLTCNSQQKTRIILLARNVCQIYFI